MITSPVGIVRSWLHQLSGVGRLLKPDPSLPLLFITEDACLAMEEEIRAHPHRETAWGIFGYVLNQGRQIYLTNVVRPSSLDVVRNVGTTILGGPQQEQAAIWLKANVDLIRRLNPDAIPQDGEFRLLFIGHSHHELGYEHYSGVHGDIGSIVAFVEQDGVPSAVGPLGLIEQHRSRITRSFHDRLPGTITADHFSHYRVSIRYYYYDRHMLQSGIRRPVLIPNSNIQIVPATQVALPIPELGWQLVNQAEWLEQLRHLRHHSCQVDIEYRDVVSGPPLEILLKVSRIGWKANVLITLCSDFPATPPTFLCYDTKDHHSAVAAYHSPNPALLEGPLWNPEEDLIEGIKRLEARGQL